MLSVGWRIEIRPRVNKRNEQQKKQKKFRFDKTKCAQNETWTKKNVDEKKCGQMSTSCHHVSDRFVHISFCFWQHTMAHKYWQCDCAECWPLVNPWNVFSPIWFFFVFYFLQHAPTVCGVVQDFDSLVKKKFVIFFFQYFFGHMNFFECWRTTFLLWTISDFWSARVSSLHVVKKCGF